MSNAEFLAVEAKTGVDLKPSSKVERLDLSQGEIGELLAAFNAASAKLTRTHEQLQAELSKLRGELAEARGQVERSRHLALLGEMAAGIAHEVRNPLGSILLYARMLQQDVAGMPGPSSTTRKIIAAVQHLEAVVGDVLIFARAGGPTWSDIVVSDLLEVAAESALAGREIEVVYSDLAVKVRADRGQLQQVMMNLIRNAAEACELSGRRKIEFGCEHVMARQADGRVEPMTAVRVKDHGPGLEDGVAERVFTPFFTTRAQGTGLGLAIVHRLVDAQGGRVSLQNWLDSHGKVGGAVAEVLLPVGQADESV
jgi:signal transduction histidine kinase